MNAIWIFAIVAAVGLNYSTVFAAPITKWFKTDNNTYYIEAQEKFTWQQAYEECKNKNMDLVTLKDFKADELLLQYLTQSFDPKPEFWLRANENIDLKDVNKLLNSVLMADYFNIKFSDFNDPQIVGSNNPSNCVLNADGAVRACETLHGYICHENNRTAGGGQNVQNIMLKFN